jgi:hypothetical protein
MKIHLSPQRCIKFTRTASRPGSQHLMASGVSGISENRNAFLAAASGDRSRSDRRPNGASPLTSMQVAGSGQRAYLLIEVLVYIAVIAALLGVGYAAMYRCVDSSIALYRNADDITSALHAGERWRADVRAATSEPRMENTDDGQLLSLEGARGTVVYRFTTNAVFRSVSAGPWAHVLEHVKSSTMAPDKREYVTAWRWELEIQPRAKGSAKPGRVRPLFTFLAVPERTATK